MPIEVDRLAGQELLPARVREWDGENLAVEVPEQVAAGPVLVITDGGMYQKQQLFSSRALRFAASDASHEALRQSLTRTKGLTSLPLCRLERRPGLRLAAAHLDRRARAGTPAGAARRAGAILLQPTGRPQRHPSDGVPVLPANYGAPQLETGITNAPANSRWDHLIYAYMIENTRIFEIFDRVVREFEAGERFETPEPDAALWLRTTEALFYRDLGSGFAGSLTSWIRPDLRATRRNTYYRLLGLHLNHGIDGNRPYTFDKPTAANR